MIEVMRAGEYAVVEAVSEAGTRSTDTYILKGLS